MLSAFLFGAAAGYAIAIPVAIALLIARTGLRRGFGIAAPIELATTLLSSAILVGFALKIASDALAPGSGTS